MPNDHEIVGPDTNKKQDGLDEQHVAHEEKVKSINNTLRAMDLLSVNNLIKKDITPTQQSPVTNQEPRADEVDAVLSGGSGAVDDIMTGLKRVDSQQRKEREAQELKLQELITKKLQELFTKEKRAQHLWRAAAIQLSFRIFSVISSAIKVAHDTLSFIGNVIPPISAAITGLTSIAELHEAYSNWKQKKEKKGRFSVKVSTSLLSVGLVIAAVVLTAVAPAIGATLSAAAIAVTVIRDLFFINKTRKDIRTLQTDVARDKMLDLPVDPEKADELKGLLASYKEKNSGKNANIAALVGATLMALAAFAVVVNPIGAGAIGVMGIVALGVSSAIACHNMYEKYKIRKIAERRAEFSHAAGTDNDLMDGYKLYKKSGYTKKKMALSSGEGHKLYQSAKPIENNFDTDATSIKHNDVTSVLKGLVGSAHAVDAAQKIVNECHASNQENAHKFSQVSINSSTKSLSEEVSRSKSRSSVSSKSSSMEEESDDKEGDSKTFGSK